MCAGTFVHSRLFSQRRALGTVLVVAVIKGCLSDFIEVALCFNSVSIRH